MEGFKHYYRFEGEVYCDLDSYGKAVMKRFYPDENRLGKRAEDIYYHFLDKMYGLDVEDSAKSDIKSIMQYCMSYRTDEIVKKASTFQIISDLVSVGRPDKIRSLHDMVIYASCFRFIQALKTE